MTHAFRWTTTSRNDACVVQLWDGRTITAPEPCGVVAWPRLCFPSWPLSNCGRSILGCGSIGTCKAAPQPGARYPTTSNHSCLGTCPKTCARNCGWECRRRYQTPVDPQPAPAIPPEAGRWLFLRRAREAVRAEHGFGGCLRPSLPMSFGGRGLLKFYVPFGCRTGARCGLLLAHVGGGGRRALQRGSSTSHPVFSVIAQAREWNWLLAAGRMGSAARLRGLCRS